MPKQTSADKCQSRKTHRSYLSELQQTKESRLLKRAADMGLVHPRLARIHTKREQPRIEAIGKHQVLQIVLERLRKGPAAQKNYRERLERIRSQGIQKPREEKPEYLCCPICIDLMVEPLALSCGHCFCRKCLETSVEYKKECPMCREPVKGIEPNPCLNMEAMIHKHLNKLEHSSLRTTYEDRIRDAQAKKKTMMLNYDLLVGSKVDIRDEKYEWNVGEIARSLKVGGVQHYVVRYRDATRQYEELLAATDPRLAPFRSHRHQNFFIEMSPQRQRGVFEFGIVNNTNSLSLREIIDGSFQRRNFLLFRSINQEQVSHQEQQELDEWLSVPSEGQELASSPADEQSISFLEEGPET